MAAYFVTQIEIHDYETYETYKKLTTPTLELFGGKFLVRGGKNEIMEGDWLPERLVVLEFPSAERAKAWWSSEEYAEAKALRHAAADTKMVLVDAG